MFRLLSCGLVLLWVIAAPAARAQEAGDVWNNLLTQGQRALTAGNYSQTEQILQQALHEAVRFAPDDWRVGVTQEILGQTYTAEKKFGEADSALTRSLAIVGNGDDPVQVANVNLDIAKLHLDEGRPAEAITFARKALATYQTSLGGTSRQTVAALCLVGDLSRSTKNYSEAESLLRRCADSREGDGGIESTDFADALYSLGLTYAGEGKYTLAEPRLKLAETIRERQLGLTNPLVAQTMEDHAALLKTMGRDKEAQRLMTLVAAIRRKEKNERKNGR